MNRYLYTEKQTNSNALKKTIYPNFDSEDFFYVNVQAFNRLDKLANKYYSDQSLYWFIILTNNLPADSIVLKDTRQIKIYNDVSDYISSMKG